MEEGPAHQGSLGCEARRIRAHWGPSIEGGPADWGGWFHPDLRVALHLLAGLSAEPLEAWVKWIVLALEDRRLHARIPPEPLQGGGGVVTHAQRTELAGVVQPFCRCEREASPAAAGGVSEAGGWVADQRAGMQSQGRGDGTACNRGDGIAGIRGDGTACIRGDGTVCIRGDGTVCQLRSRGSLSNRGCATRAARTQRRAVR